MAPPRHIAAPSNIKPGGPEGPNAAIAKSSEIRKSTTAQRTEEIQPQQEVIKTPVLYGSMFDAAPQFANRAVDLPEYGIMDRLKRKFGKSIDSTRDELAQFISEWAGKTVDEHGIKDNAGHIDRTIVELYRTMVGTFASDELVTTTTIANKGIEIIDGESVNFDNLKKNPAQIQQLLHTLRSMELYWTAIIGMEITPLPDQQDRISTFVAGRLGQYMQNGAGLVEKGTDWFFSLPGRGLETRDKKFHDAKEMERMKKELAESFRNGANGLDVGAAGFEEFVQIGKDFGIMEQRMAILKLRNLRVEMLQHLAPGRSPDKVNSTVSKKIDIVLQGEEYREYREKGLSFPDLPEHVRMYVEAQAQELVLTDKATDQAEEIWESYMLQKFEGSDANKQRHASLQKRIDELQGGPSSDQQVIDEKKTSYDTAKKAWDEKKTEIDDYQDEIDSLSNQSPVLGLKYTNAKKEHDDIVSGEISHPGTPQEKKQKILELFSDMQAALDEIKGLNVNIKDIKKKKRKSKQERVQLGKVKDKTYKEYKPYKGKSAKDKEKKELLEAIKKIVETNGERNDLVWHILRDVDPASLFREESTLFADNYNTLRRLFGIRGEMFDDIVGKDNLEFRIYLARTFHLKFDESHIRSVAVGHTDRIALDKEIWASIRRGSKSELANLAINTWDILLTTAVDTGAVTLNYKDESRKPEIIGRKKAEVLGETSRREMQQELERQGYYSGINTLSEFVKLPNGDIVAIVVDENGHNAVIDKSGKNLGAVERIGLDNQYYDPATTEAVVKIQGNIEEALGEKSILCYLAPGINPGEFIYSTLGHPQFTATSVDLTLKRVNDVWQVDGVGTGGANQPLAEYLKTDKGKIIAREAAARYIARMEHLSKNLRVRQTDIGLPQEFMMDRGRMGLEWEDLWSENPNTSEHQSMTLVLGDEGDILVMQNSFSVGQLISPRRIIRPAGPLLLHPLINVPARVINIRGRAINIPAISLRTPPINLPGIDVTTPGIDLPVENVTSTPAIPLEGPMLNQAMEEQKNRLLEAGYNALTMSSESSRQNVKPYFQNVRIDNLTSAGNVSYEITLDDNGKLIIFDKSDPASTIPTAHEALDFINERVTSRELRLIDARRIRQVIGLEYYKSLNRRIKA
ncbi:hypothetical protein A2W14_05430 [Candidatus Gottesmanbacteria bacterium RBG_16_37_8]|uniref:Uncharacterized protein n=1 Tax=Candidatus Gottesmanbacteria bacterium RBG_16_37_8 TaxID=1798371 RepID=A0A1F5YUU1_9BACT|nr:MAG: hypothetical protein A2W14_05430 [Candidatus Gottesmanbacteria bacterium RBG_16_37_8]